MEEYEVMKSVMFTSRVKAKNKAAAKYEFERSLDECIFNDNIPHKWGDCTVMPIKVLKPLMKGSGYFKDFKGQTILEKNVLQDTNGKLWLVCHAGYGEFYLEDICNYRQSFLLADAKNYTIVGYGKEEFLEQIRKRNNEK